MICCQNGLMSRSLKKWVFSIVLLLAFLDTGISTKNIFSSTIRTSSLYLPISRLRQSVRPYAVSKNEDNVPITVWVSSNFGSSSFLRKNIKIRCDGSNTVLSLKHKIQEKFPGNPPVLLQDLYFDSILLKDHEVLGNLSNNAIIPVQLDLLSGTQQYNRSCSTVKSIEAFNALSVHELFLNNKLAHALSGLNSRNKVNAMNTSSSILYRNVFKHLNESFYQEYGRQIDAAIVMEQDPSSIKHSYITPEKPYSLKAFLSHELLLHDEDISRMAVWSFGLLVYGLCFAERTSSTLLSFAGIPILWLLNLRIVRVLYKRLRNFILEISSKSDFVLRALPVPLQVMALESSKKHKL